MSNPFPHTLILGHRGAPAEALENTLRSLELAIRHGADGVEIDVQPAKDGTPVVIHDADLRRAFEIDGSVADLGWEALQRLTQARLPSFQQVAAWAAAAGAWLNVELKAGGAEAEVVRILREHGLLPRTFLSSFDERIVARVGEIDHEAVRFFLSEEWNDDARDRLVRSGAVGICLRVDAATPVALDVLRHEGIPTVVWTVDETHRIEQLLTAGVAGIITNQPATAVAVARRARAL